jgi:hypothetical protein
MRVLRCYTYPETYEKGAYHVVRTLFAPPRWNARLKKRELQDMIHRWPDYEPNFLWKHPGTNRNRTSSTLHHTTIPLNRPGPRACPCIRRHDHGMLVLKIMLGYIRVEMLCLKQYRILWCLVNGDFMLYQTPTVAKLQSLLKLGYKYSWYSPSAIRLRERNA